MIPRFVIIFWILIVCGSVWLNPVKKGSGSMRVLRKFGFSSVLGNPPHGHHYLFDMESNANGYHRIFEFDKTNTLGSIVSIFIPRIHPRPMARVLNASKQHFNNKQWETIRKKAKSKTQDLRGSPQCGLRPRWWLACLILWRNNGVLKNSYNDVLHLEKIKKMGLYLARVWIHIKVSVWDSYL